MEFLLPNNLAQKLIESHLVEGNITSGSEIHLRVDQVLLQDALSTLSMQALEAIELNYTNLKEKLDIDYQQEI